MQNKKLVGDLIANEAFHYILPHHDQLLLDKLWELGKAVRHQRVENLEYKRLKGQNTVKRRV